MSVTSGFFNSVNGDRRYNAEQMSSIFDGLIIDGVYATIGNAFLAKAGGGEYITIDIGRAWFRHTWIYNDSIIRQKMSQSDILMDRIDAIVIEVNTNESVREASIKTINGIAATKPQRPKLIDEPLIFQAPICYVMRKSGSSEIKQEDITYVVGTSETPFVLGVLKTINADDLFLKWDAAFNTFMASTSDNLQAQLNEFTAWMKLSEQEFLSWEQTQKVEFDKYMLSIKDTLTKDTAGNLFNLIDTHKKDLANPHKVTAEQINSYTKEESNNRLNTREPKFSKNTAFNKNFGTSAGTVCQGDDNRLSNARPASDVSAWAKASTKPKYIASEVGAYTREETDNLYSKSSHTHTASEIGAYTKEEINTILSIKDTRDTNESPSWYYEYDARKNVWEFKFTNKIQAPLSGLYCQLITYTPWGDNSGGYPVQFAFNDSNLCFRYGISKTEWSSWRLIVLGNDSRLSNARPASGGNSDTVDGKHIWTGTQSAYNGLSKDPNTLYFTTEG